MGFAQHYMTDGGSLACVPEAASPGVPEVIVATPTGAIGVFLLLSGLALEKTDSRSASIID
ncbi:MAG: hypothetical protein MZV63_44475 [Marinilabiliales bacterium]|nr:hypothetical protein [Marinilabiliales bacterium]